MHILAKSLNEGVTKLFPLIMPLERVPVEVIIQIMVEDINKLF